MEVLETVIALCAFRRASRLGFLWATFGGRKGRVVLELAIEFQCDQVLLPL